LDALISCSIAPCMLSSDVACRLLACLLSFAGQLITDDLSDVFYFSIMIVICF